MKQDVNINIRGLYRADDEESTTELFTIGSLSKRNGHYYITYKESETTGFEGCTTTLKVENGQVTIVRRGPTTSHLILQKGTRNVGRYEMLGSAMEIGIFTDGLESSIGDEGGNLHLEYTMDMNSVFMSENVLDISVTRQ